MTFLYPSDVLKEMRENKVLVLVLLFNVVSSAVCSLRDNDHHIIDLVPQAPDAIRVENDWWPTSKHPRNVQSQRWKRNEDQSTSQINAFPQNKKEGKPMIIGTWADCWPGLTTHFV